MMKTRMLILGFMMLCFFVHELKAQVFTGGGVSVGFVDGYVIEAAPVIGYRYKIVENGAAPFFSYIEKNQKYAYGARLFSKVTFYRDVFFHAELEGANVEKNNNRIWIAALPLGFGYRQNIGQGMNAHLSVLYNVFQTEISHTKNPIIRAGITYDL